MTPGDGQTGDDRAISGQTGEARTDGGQTRVRPDGDREPRVLVTGATGTVGSPLVARLLDAPVAVRVATRTPAAARDRFGDAAEYVEFDLDRPETWGCALDGVDRLFLLIPPVAGVTPVREFADAADRVGVRHVAYLSIIGAEKLPVLPHRRVEKHLARTGMAHTFLRASYFMQNLSEVHRPEVVERDEVFVPAGDGTLSFVDARDVAAVAAAVLIEPGHEGRAYDLTGPAALDFATVADVFTDVLGRRITYANPSRLAFARHVYRRGVPASLVAFMVLEYSVVRLGRSGRTTDDVESVLGRPPRSLRQFVRDHAETFQPAASEAGLK
ncbi:SDR family oxidoreductase [Halobacteriaceae archaeon GCM10025711]